MIRIPAAIAPYASLIKWGLIALVALAIAVAAYRQGGSAERANHADTKAKHAKVLANLAELTRKAADEARAKERAHAAALSAIDQQHQEALTRVQTDHDRLVADLRRGAVRLREPWACPAAVSNPAAAAGQRDAAAERRIEAAAAVVRVGAEADAQLAACQAVVRQDRQ